MSIVGHRLTINILDSKWQKSSHAWTEDILHPTHPTSKLFSYRINKLNTAHIRQIRDRKAENGNLRASGAKPQIKMGFIVWNSLLCSSCQRRRQPNRLVKYRVSRLPMSLRHCGTRGDATNAQLSAVDLPLWIIFETSFNHFHLPFPYQRLMPNDGRPKLKPLKRNCLQI